MERCFHTLTEYLKNADIGTDLRRYTKARLSFFSEHENEARLFFESMLQPPELLKERIAKVQVEFDEYNQNLYNCILDTLCLRPEVMREEATRYFKLIQEMFNGYFSSPAVSGLSLLDRMAAREEGLFQILDFMLYGIAKRGEEK